MNHLKQYIVESNSKGHPRGLYLFNKIPFRVTNEYPSHINLINVIARIERTIPEWCFRDVEEVFVGEFKNLKQRKVNAVFEDDAIYLLNDRDTEDHVFDDILHEVAHSLEKRYSEQLYSDDTNLREEFLGKRQRLAALLKHDKVHMPNQYVNNVEYSDEMDDFLVNEIGYDRLSGYTKDLFINPYAVTSLSEYVAVAFEKYFSGIQEDRNMVRSLCPTVYRSLQEIEEENAA
jgi:hypothetical protein